MNEPRHGWTDYQVEQVVGVLLRVGVLLAAAVVLLGAVLYLAQEGTRRIRTRWASAEGPDVRDLSHFKGERPGLDHVRTVAEGAARFEGRYVIQFGILLLVATPVARVALCVLAFLAQRDRLYIGVTLFVLAVLLASLAGWVGG
jgi:uncharacterized membrane protein